MIPDCARFRVCGDNHFDLAGAAHELLANPSEHLGLSVRDGSVSIRLGEMDTFVGAGQVLQRAKIPMAGGL